MNPDADNFFVPHTKDPFHRGALKMVIGGFIRSGTTWVAAAINGCKKGPVAGHEEPFRYDGFSRDTNSDKVEVSVSGFLTPYLEDLERERIPVVHLVRNPVAVVNSCLQHFGNEFWVNYRIRAQREILGIETCTDEERKENAVYVAKVWVEWTQKAADYSKYLVRLEDLVQDVEVLAYIMQKEGIEIDAGELVTASASAERRASRLLPGVSPITEKDLPPEVFDWAKRLGYTSSEVKK